MFFRRSYFQIVDVAPAANQRVRYWDRAATVPSEANPNPDWSAGVLLSRDTQGTYYVEHVERFQGTPAKVEMTIKTIAAQDGEWVSIGIEQDPGSARQCSKQDYPEPLLRDNER